MKICNNQHQEICFEGGTCPLCQIIEEMENRISDLEDQIAVKIEQLEQLEQ